MKNQFLYLICLGGLVIFTLACSTPKIIKAPKNSLEQAAVHQVIKQLFDGMRQSDSSMVSACFHPKIIMHSIGKNKAGETQILLGDATQFLGAVGTPKTQIWDERISDINIIIDGSLASVWMDYTFYIDETFSHCGVNSMQLVKEDEIWKIIYLIDTRRKTNCN